MYEWLEGLQKSARRSEPGVDEDSIRRAETESGVPMPEELVALYRRVNGGVFQGEVTLFPMHAPEGEPSVLEKTRLKLEGLPAAGLWRFGVKGAHRNLFTARKSAMREQANGGPQPSWMDALGDDDWVYGTWDTEKREMRLYRSLEAMMAVLVPPAEVEEFGDRTYARALSAVQGVLSMLEGAEEGDGEAGGSDSALQQAVVAAAERRLEELRQATDAQAEPEGAQEAEPAAAPRRARKAVKKAAKAEAPAEAEQPAPSKAPKEQPAKKERKPAPRRMAKKAPAKRAATRGAKKAAAKPAGKKAPAKRTPTKGAKKAAAKRAAKKAPAQRAAKKAPARRAAKKAPARRVAKKAPARRAAKKSSARRARR